MKRAILAVLLVGALLGAFALPVMADSYSGMVVDITAYNLVVKNGGDVKIFQIRAQTAGTQNVHEQDKVRVDYQNLSGILVAVKITVLSRP